jgi:hypothetical protein
MGKMVPFGVQPFSIRVNVLPTSSGCGAKPIVLEQHFFADGLIQLTGVDANIVSS